MGGPNVLTSATAPILGGVEVLNFRNAGINTTGNLAGGITPDLTTLNYVSPAADVSFTNIPVAVTTLGLSNVTAATTANYTYAAGLTGTADAASLNLTNTNAENVADPTVQVFGATGGIEVLNVVATGSNNLTDLLVRGNAGGAPADTSLTTLNIGGTGSFGVDNTITFSAAAATPTINASANTGGVTVLVSGTGNTSFTGGSGNDIFGIDVANFNTADTVNGGTGTNTLALFAADVVGAGAPNNLVISAATTALNAAISAATNIQTIGLAAGRNTPGVSGNVTLAANVLAQTNYTFFSAGNITVTAIAGDTINLQENGQGGTVALTGSLGTTALTLNVNAANGNQAGALALTASGFTTITLGLNNDGTVAVAPATAVGAFTVDNNTSVIATGNSAFTTDFATSAATGTGVIYNGSAVTGVQNITGTALADSITGGANADFLVGEAGNDTIIGGAGNDTITGGLGADNITTGAGVDRINVVGNIVGPAINSDSVIVVNTTPASPALTGAITAANLATVTRQYDIVTADAGDILDVALAGLNATLLTNNGTTGLIIGGAVAAGSATYWNDGTNTYFLASTDAVVDTADTFVVFTGVRTFAATQIVVVGATAEVDFTVIS